MDTKISQWGNSLGVRIPKALADQAGLQKGDAVDIEPTPEGLLLRRQTRADEYTLEELLAQWPEGVKADEADWGPSQGKELW